MYNRLTDVEIEVPIVIDFKARDDWARKQHFEMHLENGDVVCHCFKTKEFDGGPADKESAQGARPTRDGEHWAYVNSATGPYSVALPVFMARLAR